MNKLFFLIISLFFFSCISREGENKKNLNIRAYMSGKNIYAQSCSQCHGDKGEGYRSLYPALVKDSSLAYSLDHIICVVKNGTAPNNKPDPKHIYMPANPEFNSDHISDLVSFLEEEWGNGKDFKSAEQVMEVLKDCP